MARTLSANVAARVTTSHRPAPRQRHSATAATTTGTSSQGVGAECRNGDSPPIDCVALPPNHSASTPNCPMTVRTPEPTDCVPPSPSPNQVMIFRMLLGALRRTSATIGAHTTAAPRSWRASGPPGRCAAPGRRGRRPRAGVLRQARTPRPTAPAAASGRASATKPTWTCATHEATPTPSGSAQRHPHSIDQVSMIARPNGQRGDVAVPRVVGELGPGGPQQQRAPDRGGRHQRDPAVPSGHGQHPGHGGAVDGERTEVHADRGSAGDPVERRHQVEERRARMAPVGTGVQADQHLVTTDVTDLQLGERVVGDGHVRAADPEDELDRGQDQRGEAQRQDDPLDPALVGRWRTTRWRIGSRGDVVGGPRRPAPIVGRRHRTLGIGNVEPAVRHRPRRRPGTAIGSDRMVTNRLPPSTAPMAVPSASGQTAS